MVSAPTMQNLYWPLFSLSDVKTALLFYFCFSFLQKSIKLSIEIIVESIKDKFSNFSKNKICV